MKRAFFSALLLLALTIAPTMQSHAIVWTVITAVIKKVIIAMDIAIQKLQNKTIWLQQAQKELENAMSKLRLKQIGDWAEKQRVLYRDYYEELQKVKSTIAYYNRIKAVTVKQLQLVAAYKRSSAQFNQDAHFSGGELSYMGKVYGGMLEASVKNIDAILMVIHDFTLQMTDAQRLEIINRAAARIDSNYADLLRFNEENQRLSLARAKDLNDIALTKKLYGLLPSSKGD